MTVSKAEFKHKPVSKWFVLDWQFILATGRFPIFKPAVAVITALPFVSDMSRVVPIDTKGFWLFWTASVLSWVTFALTHYFCPDFIRKYEDFAAFDKMGHTHRWILWLFHLNLTNYINRDYVVRETVEKGLTRPVSELFKKNAAMPSAISFEKTPSKSEIVVGSPANVMRDLYIPIWIDKTKHLLTLNEDDQKLGLKIKEIFWIIFTDLTKSGFWVRRLIWFLYAIILTLTVLGICLNVVSLFWNRDVSVNPIIKLLHGLCGAFL